MSGKLSFPDDALAFAFEVVGKARETMTGDNPDIYPSNHVDAHASVPGPKYAWHSAGRSYFYPSFTIYFAVAAALYVSITSSSRGPCRAAHGFSQEGERP